MPVPVISIHFIPGFPLLRSALHNDCWLQSSPTSSEHSHSFSTTSNIIPHRLKPPHLGIPHTPFSLQHKPQREAAGSSSGVMLLSALQPAILPMTSVVASLSMVTEVNEKLFCFKARLQKLLIHDDTLYFHE